MEPVPPHHAVVSEGGVAPPWTTAPAWKSHNDKPYEIVTLTICAQVTHTPPANTPV